MQFQTLFNGVKLLFQSDLVEGFFHLGKGDAFCSLLHKARAKFPGFLLVEAELVQKAFDLLGFFGGVLFLAASGKDLAQLFKVVDDVLARLDIGLAPDTSEGTDKRIGLWLDSVKSYKLREFDEIIRRDTGDALVKSVSVKEGAHDLIIFE